MAKVMCIHNCVTTSSRLEILSLVEKRRRGEEGRVPLAVESELSSEGEGEVT